MSVLKDSKDFKTLMEIIGSLGNKDYDVVEFRCKWVNDSGECCDTWYGSCSYKNGVLLPFDGDSYSLDDVYAEWEEQDKEKLRFLVVWEYGII